MKVLSRHSLTCLLFATNLSSARVGAEAPAFANAAFLDRDTLVRAVLERNPGLEESRAQVRAAAARLRQRAAIADPTFEYGLAPRSIGSNAVDFGQEIRLRQELPLWGKRGLNGAIARAEGEARAAELKAQQVELAWMAAALYEEYFATAEMLRINAGHRALLGAWRNAAQSAYSTGGAGSAEMFNTEIELAELDRQRLELETRRDVVATEIRALVHEPPGASLPPPRASDDPPSIAPFDSLLAEALRQRPELRAVDAELRGNGAMLRLSRREFIPDIGLMGSYESMWHDPEHRWMVGVMLNVPIWIGPRLGAIEEARALESANSSRRAALADRIAADVETARLRALLAQEIVRSYEQRSIPAARTYAETQRALYETGGAGLGEAIAAERTLRRLELEHAEARAQRNMRDAELQRTLGRLPASWNPGGS